MTFPDNSRLLATIPERHSVRAYLDRRPESTVLNCLQTEIDRINVTNGLSFKLVTDEPTAFSGFLAHYGKFSGVRDYIIIAAPAGDNWSRRCGYWGERLVLGLQAMGLNTCWVGLSFRKSTDDFRMPSGTKIRCVIALGYGVSQGVTHRTKTVEQVSNCNDASPEWFRKGIESALLAPTAINQQKFRFTLHDDGSVTAETRLSLVGYTMVDLGIAIFHFNLAAPAHTISPD